MRLTYNTKLVFQTEDDKNAILAVLEASNVAWNECSKTKFVLGGKNSLVDLHAAFYRKFRDAHPEIPSQVVIAVERAVLSAYRSIKSNKQKISAAPERKRPSIRLDGRTYTYKKGEFGIVSLGRRVKCKPYLYPRLAEAFEKYQFCDPLIFVRNGEIWMAVTFEPPIPVLKPTLAVGVDLGCRTFAATSEGKLYRDPEFSTRKRKVRYIKRTLESKGTKPAMKHLRKIGHKERNQNKNFTHLLANAILRNTKADVIVVENLKSIKVKKHKFQNKNRISQVPMYELRRILTYKAPLLGKTVIAVCPSYTSQIDHRTGKRDGKRTGARYTGKDGQVLHADVNAACNIALRSEHPCSIGNYFAWQAEVTRPIVCQSYDRKIVGITSS